MQRTADPVVDCGPKQILTIFILSLCTITYTKVLNYINEWNLFKIRGWMLRTTDPVVDCGPQKLLTISSTCLLPVIIPKELNCVF